VNQGSANETLARPREVFKPAIVHSPNSFILVHNHPSGDPSPSEADLRLTRRILEAGRILQLNLIDHVIIGSPAPGRSSYFSFNRSPRLLLYGPLGTIRRTAYRAPAPGPGRLGRRRFGRRKRS
jgi:DNA repair protein RadC